MDYQTLLAAAKQAIVSQKQNVNPDALDAIWNGRMMEMARILMQDRENDQLFMVTINEMDSKTYLKTYVREK